MRGRFRLGVLHDQPGVEHREVPRLRALHRVVGVELEFVVEFVAGDIVIDQLFPVELRGVDLLQKGGRFEVDARRTVKVGQLDAALVEAPCVVHLFGQIDVAVEVVDRGIGLVGGVFVDQLLVQDVTLGVRKVRFAEDAFQRFDPLFAACDVGVAVREGGVELREHAFQVVLCQDRWRCGEQQGGKQQVFHGQTVSVRSKQRYE